MKSAFLLAVAVVFALLPSTGAQASHDCVEFFDCGVHVTPGKGSFDVGAVKSDTVPGRGTPGTHGKAPGRTTWIELEEDMAPTCLGNTRTGGDALCPAALTTCPPGQLRWWVWHRETRVTLDPNGGDPTRDVGPWQQEPGSFCLGNDDPGVPDYGRAISIIQQGFRNLPLPVADVQVDPAPTTLVNIPTAFYAGGAQTFTQTVTPVPGISVTVNAKPTTWTWFWGDGTSQAFTTAGAPKRPEVSHVYAEARDHSAYVEVIWTGTFSIAGSSQVFDIATPATVTSPPVAVQVREARAELVDG
jgi:hypothetical protein